MVSSISGAASSAGTSSQNRESPSMTAEESSRSGRSPSPDVVMSYQKRATSSTGSSELTIKFPRQNRAALLVYCPPSPVPPLSLFTAAQMATMGLNALNAIPPSLPRASVLSAYLKSFPRLKDNTSASPAILAKSLGLPMLPRPPAGSSYSGVPHAELLSRAATYLDADHPHYHRSMKLYKFLNTHLLIRPSPRNPSITKLADADAFLCLTLIKPFPFQTLLFPALTQKRKRFNQQMKSAASYSLFNARYVTAIIRQIGLEPPVAEPAQAFARPKISQVKRARVDEGTAAGPISGSAAAGTSQAPGHIDRPSPVPSPQVSLHSPPEPQPPHPSPPLAQPFGVAPTRGVQQTAVDSPSVPILQPGGRPSAVPHVIPSPAVLHPSPIPSQPVPTPQRAPASSRATPLDRASETRASASEQPRPLSSQPSPYHPSPRPGSPQVYSIDKSFVSARSTDEEFDLACAQLDEAQTRFQAAYTRQHATISKLRANLQEAQRVIEDKEQEIRMKDAAIERLEEEVAQIIEAAEHKKKIEALEQQVRYLAGQMEQARADAKKAKEETASLRRWQQQLSVLFSASPPTSSVGTSPRPPPPA